MGLYMAKLASLPAGFSALEYLAANKDLINAYGTNGAAAAEHYLNFGYSEGRPTSFNAAEYLASNPDLIRAYGSNGMAAMEHYINYGVKEGRSIDSFSDYYYLVANPDVGQAVDWFSGKGVEHWLSHGYYEGRSVKNTETNTTTTGTTTTTTIVTTVQQENRAPEVGTIINAYVPYGSKINGSELTSFADLDGDRLTYGVMDTGDGGGYFKLNGVKQPAHTWIYVNSLSQVDYYAGKSSGWEDVYLCASDGKVWSDTAVLSIYTDASSYWKQIDGFLSFELDSGIF